MVKKKSNKIKTKRKYNKRKYTKGKFKKVGHNNYNPPVGPPLTRRIKK